MLSFYRLAYLVSALAATARSRIIVMNCNQGTQKQDVDNAIDDVTEVAKGM
jgi:chloramphenicol 3-O-phosphotransferase